MTALADKFMRSVEADPFGGCWLWSRCILNTGYGQFFPNHNAKIAAHRFAWELFRGPIPPGVQVLHRCDVRACVNPDHLFLGTHVDNMADMVAKKRSAAGERSAHAKLTAKDIPTIRWLRQMGMAQEAIGKMFGVSQVKISQIELGKAWRHVP